MLLCVVMLAGMIPASVMSVFAATGDPTIVIAGSDYQNTNGGLFSSGASTDAYAIMSQIKEDYSTAYGFLFGGDYYAHDVNTTTQSTNGKNQLKGEIVDVLYPDMADENQVYIQGNHDADSLTTNGTLATSGAHDTDKYGVYVINEKDYMWYNDNQSTIKNTASALESYLDAKVAAGYSKPIFVLSHLPLHYSNRTAREGDGKYAKYIYDVLDQAGANDLNIIFMYGHNHSTSYYEEYLGNAAVYLAEGDTIYVANEGSQTSCFSDTLNFTYMNYGFTGYLTGTAADGALTMTVFEIYEDEVKVKRYDESGVHNLKSAGTNGSTPAGASVNTTIYTSPQTIKLTTPEVKATFTDNGVTVTAGGITSVTASKAEEPTYNSALYSGYEEYTVSAGNFEAGKTATVTIALTEGDFDTTRTVTVKLPSGSTKEVAVTNGTITFEATQLGTFTLMQKQQTTIEIPGDSGSGDTGDGTIWRRVTSFTAGKKYMLVNYGDNATGVGTFAVNSTAGGTAVTVQTDSTGAYIENSNMALAWTYNANAELVNADTNQYLYIASYPSGTSGVKVNVTNSVTTGTSYSSWKLANNTGVNETSLSAYRNGSSNYYPARWSNGGAEYLAYTSTQTSKHDNWIAIFEQTSEGGSSGDTDYPTVDTPNVGWVTITQPSGGTTTYTYELTDTIVSGESYLIGSGNNGSVNILNSNGGTISGTTTNGIFTTTSSVTDAYKWTFTGSGTSYTIQNVSTDGYLYPTASRIFSWSYSLETDGSNTSVTVDNNSGALTVSRRVTSGSRSTTSYMTNSFGAASSGSNVYIYKIVEHTSDATGGLYGKLDGELSYTVPYGTSEAVALSKVKGGIAIKYATKSDYSDEATFPDDGEGMSWEVVNYDGNTPGEYAVNISYNGTRLGTAKIVVNPKPAGTAQATIDSAAGTVRQNAGLAALTGNKLTLTYDDGTTETVNVTLGMVKDANGNNVDTSVPGVYPGLKVVYTYGGVEYTICNNYTLTVRENVQNNYPEYPDEGAVGVNKTATGIDFQSSGIAQVELSTSGVPSKKGVDVIVMVDTSSSMKRGAGTNAEVQSPNRRIDFLQVALANLIREFQAVGDDGEQLDINVAIAEFNGYSFISGEDEPSDSSQQGASNVALVFTGDGSKTADAFVAATTITDPDTFAKNIGEHSGTNYDYAFDTVYRLGAAINAKNAANGEDRDLFVIFMSDGAPYGYNYYGSGTTDTWDDYLNGNMTLNSSGQIVDDTGVYLKGNTHFYRTDGKHWMAEAVKGSTTEKYMVIDPTDSLGNDATAADVQVYEDAGIILTEGETSYFRMVPGLGAEVHTIGFCLYDDDQSNGNIVYATTQKSLMQRLASTDSYGNVLYHETESGSDLNDIFCEIASQIAYAANNARYVDQMGEEFNLQMATSQYTVVENGVETPKPLTPKIEILSYAIWTRQDFLDGLCTEEMIGDRKSTTPTVLETVTFSADGTQAYSNLIDGGKTNILADGNTEGYVKGVIYAKNFLYNTNATAVTVTGVDIPTGKNSSGLTTGSSAELPSETFYWKLGTVQTSELAMRYYVYLEGSMEGTKEAGSYPTNEYATLYYDNYLSNPCYKDTTSPVMAWKEANVSYAFYLVNENGEVIVNQTTGATGFFANKIAVTNPVVYETVLLNNDEEVSSIDIASLGVLPEGYTLYDYNGTNGATYTVTINSNTTGSWEITSVKDVKTTYVMQYNPNNADAYSKETTVNTIGYDYTHTVVWFAVVWKVQALPDAVVVDYGLPMDISVLTNDMFGENGKLAGIGSVETAGVTLDGFTASNVLTGTEYTGKYGVAKADLATGEVRYTLNTMQMDSYDKFAYAVNYTGATNPGYYYDTVTVIPATTIYYEDSFLTYSAENTEWEDVGTVIQGATQDEDRPGQYSLTDANNIYGYDSVNNGMATYSLGSAKKVHVGEGSFATASFTFMGTGFDVLSMTSNTTGTITVKVTDAKDNKVEAKAVNTYYGYTKDQDGNWTATPDTAAALYQVPVMQVNGLTYGQYTVTITATWAAALDKTTADGYDLYLDAIRIYDPANNGAQDDDTVIEDAYKADGEGWPTYVELRNQLLAAGSFDANDKLTGAMFIDGVASMGDANIGDYESYGPNNEVYLAPGQSVAFLLELPANAANVHIGLSSADGVKVTYTITNIAQATNSETGVTEGDYYNAKTYELNTATDMYYDMSSWKKDIIVITNTGNRYNTAGVLAISNIKTTYTSAPVAVAEEPVLYMTRSAAMLTLRRMNTSDPVEDTVGDTNVPETDVTEPEVDVTEPESGNTGNTNTDNTNSSNGNTTTDSNTEVEDTVTGETNAPEVDNTVTEDNGTDDTTTDEPAEDAPEVEIPEEDIPAEEEPTEQPAEQLSFWARLWNAIKSAFNRLFSWLGF